MLTFPAPGVAQWIDDGSLTGGMPPLAAQGARSYRVVAQ
jgi:hypothetical protein